MASLELKKILQARGGDASTLEGNLLSAAPGGGVKSVFVTSSRPGEGKTTAAVTIAHALSATAAGRVLLVDGNRAAPKLDKLYEVNKSPGLVEFLLSDGGEDALTASLRDSGFGSLALMPFGGNGAGPADSVNDAVKDRDYSRLAGILSKGAAGGSGPSFDTEPFRRALEKLESVFAYVVFDGDSVLTSSNASIVAKFFDGVVFVVECEKTKWEVLRLAQEKIANVGGNPLGVVLNKRRYYIPRGLYGKI